LSRSISLFVSWCDWYPLLPFLLFCNWVEKNLIFDFW
jgi:hypothetical protein